MASSPEGFEPLLKAIPKVSPLAPEDILGRRVRQERERRGWSQAELAERLKDHGVELHFTAIAKIEQRDSERPRAIRFNEAMALAEVFEMSVDRLLASPQTVLQTARQRVERASASLVRSADLLENQLAALSIAALNAGEESAGVSAASSLCADVAEVAGRIEAVVRNGWPLDELAEVVDKFDRERSGYADFEANM